MHKTKAAFVLCACLAACGGDLMPQVGTALNKVRDVVEGVEEARAGLEEVYNLICTTPDALPQCVKARAVLDKTSDGVYVAAETFNDVAEAYTELNEDL